MFGNDKKKLIVIASAAVLVLVIAGVILAVALSKKGGGKQSEAKKTESESEEKTYQDKLGELMSENMKKDNDGVADQAETPQEDAPEQSGGKTALDLAGRREALAISLGTGFEEGQVLEDFAFKDANGKEMHVSDLLGKPVYINFFTTWCPYCTDEIPDMQKVKNDYGPDEVSVIMIDVMETTAETDAYTAEQGIDFPVYFLDDWFAGSHELVGVPISFVIDRYGVITGVNEGLSNYKWMSQAMQKAVESE